MKNHTNKNKREQRKNEYKITEEDIKRLDEVYAIDESNKHERRKQVIERLKNKRSYEIDQLIDYMNRRNKSSIKGLQNISTNQTLSQWEFDLLIECVTLYKRVYHVMFDDKYGKEYNENTIKNVHRLEDKLIDVHTQISEELINKDIVPLFIDYRPKF